MHELRLTGTSFHHASIMRDIMLVAHTYFIFIPFKMHGMSGDSMALRQASHAEEASLSLQRCKARASRFFMMSSGTTIRCFSGTGLMMLVIGCARRASRFSCAARRTYLEPASART